jgi:anti-sigma factor RsiW
MDHAEAKGFVEAYVDGELAPGRSTAFETHLAGCAECQADVERLSANRAVLGEVLDPGPAPAALRDRIARIAMPPAAPALDQRARRAQPAWWAQAAALVGVAVLASGATFLTMNQSGLGERGQTLLDAHVRAQAPGRMIDVASADSHTVKPWLDARLDFAPPVRDFTAQGFPLIGGRLDYVDGRRAAVLVYGRRKHVVDVFVRPSGDGARPPAAVDRRGYHLIGWRQDGFDWWAVSDIDANELTALKRLMANPAAGVDKQ